MKNLIILAPLFLLLACSKPEKPKLTIDQYNRQMNTVIGVVTKILDEPDYKKMHQIALAVESARAVSCTTVTEECNLLGKILNRIVFATQTGPLSMDERINLFKWVAELDKEGQKGIKVLEKQWAEYDAAIEADKK